MSEPNPEQAARMAQQLARMRFDYIFQKAWYSIAEECGYRIDMALNTASHGTIAIRSYLFQREQGVRNVM